jgi:hypothetical protein
MGLLPTWLRTRPDGKAVPVIQTRYAVPAYLGVCLITAFVAWRAGLTHPEEPRAKQQTPPASH